MYEPIMHQSTFQVFDPITKCESLRVQLLVVQLVIAKLVDIVNNHPTCGLRYYVAFQVHQLLRTDLECLVKWHLAGSDACSSPNRQEDRKVLHVLWAIASAFGARFHQACQRLRHLFELSLRPCTSLQGSENPATLARSDDAGVQHVVHFDCDGRSLRRLDDGTRICIKLGNQFVRLVHLLDQLGRHRLQQTIATRVASAQTESKLNKEMAEHSISVKSACHVQSS